MKQRSATANRILEASLKMFNARGYSATSVTEIAASLGMSQGNLTYHFPTKRDLAMTLENDALQLMKDRRNRLNPGTVADDYAEHLLFGMELTWRYRFLMRDRIHYAGEPIGRRPDSELTADYGELLILLKRMHEAGLFLAGHDDNIETLARSLWIVSRYWIDHLRELEGLEQTGWADQKRGIEHHIAILSPFLKTSAREQLQAALQHALTQRMAGNMAP
ncbi:MAG: TetR/AcrR family transcriptional regulator [Pseudomonadota bacterium]